VVRCNLAGLQVREVLGEARPRVHLQQQVGDLDARQQAGHLIDQRLGRVGNHGLLQRDLQPRCRDERVRQGLGAGQAIDESRPCTAGR
jgi:hypothetical protein